MTESQDESGGKRRISPLGIVLTVIFCVALIMGPGPGILLVNRPTPIFGMPAVYVWGLLWYLVEVGVVIAAYLWVWKDPPDHQPGVMTQENESSQA